MLWQPGAELTETFAIEDTNWLLYLDESVLHVDFGSDHRVLSSAVLNGGLGYCRHFVNLGVDQKCAAQRVDPATRIEQAYRGFSLRGPLVGMMTAASMRSCRANVIKVEQHVLLVALTSGLANARAAGDRAEYRQLFDTVTHAGTINILVCFSAPLTDTAMVEALSIVTEAKVQVMHDFDVASLVSDRIATGTGTDATAVVCSQQGGKKIRYAGKHTLFGEQLAQSVYKTLSSSLVYSET